MNSLALFFEWIILASVIFLSAWFLFTNNSTQLTLFWKILVASEVIHQVGKFLSPWKRPFYENGKKAPLRSVPYSKGSFPSGHGLRAVIILYFLALESKVLLLVFAPALILSVFSRVVLSLHYPIDIVGGMILGYLLTSIFEKLIR